MTAVGKNSLVKLVTDFHIFSNIIVVIFPPRFHFGFNRRWGVTEIW